MKAIIPVAGAGTKLRPHTYTQPKALIPLAGQTILSINVDQLNEAGCMGDAYIVTSLGFAQSIPMLEKGQPAQVLDAAKSQADTLWKDNGERAKKENGCR